MFGGMMLSCKKASELIEKRKVTGLSLMESLRLSMHKRMCDFCNTYEKESLLLDKAIKNHFSNQKKPELKLDAEAKNRITNTIKSFRK